MLLLRVCVCVCACLHVCDIRPLCICAWQSMEAGSEGCMEAAAAVGDTQCQESSERQRERTREDASLADCVEGGQWSITNRIHLSAWLIFPIKTAQQEPQQSTSWNRGYFSACLSAGCVCICVYVLHLSLTRESEVWGSITIFQRIQFTDINFLLSSHA